MIQDTEDERSGGMRFPPSFLDELRSRVSLVDLIGRKVALKRAGREWKALCPFHQEKTPSFHVVEDKGFYHCFGCGAHGDAIRWLQETEGLDFVEAVRELAGQAGLALPAETEGARERGREQRFLRLFALLEDATVQFTRMLTGAHGAKARAYLERRGIQRGSLAHFRLGYAPPGRLANQLIEELQRKGYTSDDLVAAGLLVRREDRAETLLPRFRDRVMFPIADARGQVVGFGGRSLSDHPAKYLNSPDGPLFHKGRLLYHYREARQAARDGNLLVVEGYMDVIALAQAGFPAAVAPLGTAVSEQQLALAWKLAPEPIFCFDGDAAGRQAADRVIARALPMLGAGRSLRFVMLPEGEDPDSFLQQAGKEAFARLIEQAVPLVEMLWQIEVGGADLSTPERRRRAEESLFRRIEAIPDRRLAELYRETYWKRLRPVAVGGAGRGRFAGRGRPRRPSPALLSSRLVRTASGERARLGIRLLQLARAFPAFLEADAEEIAGLALGAAWLDRLRDAFLEALHQNPGLDRDRLDAHLRRRGLAAELDRLAEEAFGGLGPDRRGLEDERRARCSWQEIRLRLRDLVLEAEETGLTANMAEAGDPGLWERLKSIRRERREIAETLKAAADRDLE